MDKDDDPSEFPVARRTDGKTTPLPEGGPYPKNVQTFDEMAQKMLDSDINLNAEIEERLKNRRPKK